MKILPANKSKIYAHCAHAAQQQATEYTGGVYYRPEMMDDAPEGEQMHARAAEILKSGVEIPEGENDEVIYYVNTIRAQFEKRPGAQLLIEQELQIGDYLATNSIGYADAIIDDADGFNEVFIFDFKTGQKRVFPWYDETDAEGTGTAPLVLYAYTYAQQYGRYPDKITIAIIQNGETRSHTMTYEEMVELARGYNANFELIQNGSTETTHGIYCKDCPDHGLCPHYITSIYNCINAALDGLDSAESAEDVILALATLSIQTEGYRAKAEAILLNDPDLMKRHADQWERRENEKSVTVNYTGRRILNKNEM